MGDIPTGCIHPPTLSGQARQMLWSSGCRDKWSMMFYLFLFAAGSSVGFLSGLLGIGGGIVMFPLLHYLTPALGFDAIDVRSITGLTMIQGFCASASAMLFYNKHRLVNKSLVFSLGGALFLSSLTGALLSERMPDEPLLLIFGLLALIAAVMMFMPRSYANDYLTEDQVTFNRGIAIAIGIALGVFLGMVGQGGAFIIIPIMLYILKVPLRVAVGSMLAIGIFSSGAGLAGKVVTGQVPFLMAGAMLLGAIPFARVGGYVGKKTNTRILKWLLALIIAGTAIKIMMDIV
ncbi:MAG TPA: sulfite exporter TauE/SafE family protein [Nitrospirae bacterium]|nr:sulfite exporter TauE/SafE family protein [Nitrospirota bacterium]HDO22939.1 sulfite exporter TauE/SafE family protein [Nitrospirota bacterium]HDZ88758.1 sulfite exporter TauE/SafE family protein [Nitrospirota bacterium]